MGSEIATGVAMIIAAVSVTGCSSTASSHPQADQPISVISNASTSAAPTLTTTTPPSTPVAATTTTSAQAKPVSALLAEVTAPVTSDNMPKANTAWIAAVQKTMNDGTTIAKHGGVPANLMALVDEAAKTSDLDALIKLCNSCTDPARKAALTQAMTQKDSSGRPGFAQLSFVLEHTHPGQPYTQSSGGEFPGFVTPQHALASTDPNHAPLTSLDKADMKTLGVTSAGDYKGVKVEFMNLDDGPNAYDGWVGLATDS